jgi:hypothetical protein
VRTTQQSEIAYSALEAALQAASQQVLLCFVNFAFAELCVLECSLRAGGLFPWRLLAL